MTRDLFHSSMTAIAVALAMAAPAQVQEATEAPADSQATGQTAASEAETGATEPVTASEQAAPADETEPPGMDADMDEDGDAQAEAATEMDPTTGTGATDETTEDADAPVAVVETADASTCPALAVIDEGSGKVERVLKLVNDGLAQPSNLNTAYQALKDPIEESLAENDYDPACYKATIEAAQPLSTDEISGVPPTVLTDVVVRGWAEKCGEMSDSDGVFMCLEDTGQAISEGLLTNAQAITLVNALPLETVTMDDGQIDSLLMIVKEQVDAGNLTKSTQGQIVNRLMNQ